MRRCTLLILTLISTAIVSACGSDNATQQSFAITIPPTVGIQLATDVPTATLIPPTPTLTPTLTLTATRTPRPSSTPVPTDTPIPTDTPEPTITPTLERIDHYLFGRPIARQGTYLLDRTYSYGTTQRGARQVHLGVDFWNPTGTPVLAVAGGTVYYAGSDLDRIFGPQNNYYGNVVVLEHGFNAPDGRQLYTLYGHLDRINVETGQQVEAGDQIATVGGTGVAIGPHLHFEVRAGNPDDYLSTLNPDLWIFPLSDFGTLAGRVTDARGNLVREVEIQVRAPEITTRYAYTYADDTVNSDPAWEENFTYGDLPAGEFEVLITQRSGRVRFRQTVTIEPNHTTWLEIQLDGQ